MKNKLKKRQDQLSQAEGMVKKQKDELRRIQKEINPKLVKKLYKLLEKKTPEKITTMLEALVGLLRNSENCSPKDVEVRFLWLKPLGLFEKTRRSSLQNAEDESSSH